MSEQRFNEVPEFSRHDTTTRRREIAAAGASPQQHLEIIKQRLKAPNLTAIETEIQPASLINCTEQFKVLGLLTGPNQRIKKRIFEQWYDGINCIRANYTLDFQFTGYGGYCLSFEKDSTNSGLFGKFFGDIAFAGVNLHRTIVFVNENLENKTGVVFSLLNPGDPHQVTLRADYLANLNKLVTQAKPYGIVIQVCLFMHHSVANDGGATTPSPIVLTGSPAQRYKDFYNTKSLFLPMQQHLIDAVVTQLNGHWNVVYEIGNELRVPGTIAGYDKTNLTAWIDWAAARIRMTDPNHLITTSTGIDNEADVNHLSRIQFCSFHQKQWVPDMNDAVAVRAQNKYGGKHVVLDDDGGARLIDPVRAWSSAALNANHGCCASFNHKGPSPMNIYNDSWKTQAPAAGESQPSLALDALNNARVHSTSPCAEN